MAFAERVSARLRVPVDCRDAALLAARWHGVVQRAAELRPATRLDLLQATDALRRPERLDTLLDVQREIPGMQPAGLIFHMSRCGSTLISQMLAAEPANIVLSEAAPIDDILRAHFRQPGLPEQQRVEWLQAMVKVLAWRRRATEKHV